MTAPTVARRDPGQLCCRLDRPISEAWPGGPGQPDRAKRSEPRSGALDGRATRSYPSHHGSSTINHNHPDRPMTHLETGCVKDSPNSAKDSDTGQWWR
jgi:hypothetical protein